MSALNGGFVYPWREEDGEGGYKQHVGISLRDYFAGQAFAGIMTNYRPESGASAGHVSLSAYAYADAMLRRRAETEVEK